MDGGLGSVWNAICDNASNLICSVSFVARQNRFDRTSFQTQIIDLSHDGRGVARPHGEGGKVTFVTGALPGEVVIVEPVARNRHFDEARVVGVAGIAATGDTALLAFWCLFWLCIAAFG